MNEIRNMLSDKGLRVTPQRVSVLEAILKLNNHPVTEQIISYVQERNPNIASGTVYKILDIMVDNGLIYRVKTENDIMRYDAITDKHHHVYCSDCERIEDYFDDELNKLLEDYFKSHHIPGFKIDDIKLQIIGRFDDQHE